MNTPRSRIVAVVAAWVGLAAVAPAPAQTPPNPNDRPSSPIPVGRPESPGIDSRPRSAPIPVGRPESPGLDSRQNRTSYRPTQYQQYQQGDPGSYGSNAYDQSHPASRSVLRNQGTSPSTWGFRNPGGVGRYAEYYPPNNQFQNGNRDPVVRAGFDQGLPVGSIQEQAMATNVGTRRYSVMQQHMDNFARPLGFYGFYGFGGVGPF